VSPPRPATQLRRTLRRLTIDAGGGRWFPATVRAVFWLGGGAIVAVGAWVLVAPGMGRRTGEEHDGNAPPSVAASSPTGDTRTPEKIAEDEEKAAKVKADGAAPVATREPAKLSSKSRAAFCAEFRKLGLKFHKAPLADGTPRDLASDKTAMVDAVGHGDALESASLTFVAQRADAVAVFMRATGWASGAEWVMTATAKSDGSVIVEDGVRYQLTPAGNMFALSAEDAP